MEPKASDPLRNSLIRVQLLRSASMTLLLAGVLTIGAAPQLVTARPRSLKRQTASFLLRRPTESWDLSYIVSLPR